MLENHWHAIHINYSHTLKRPSVYWKGMYHTQLMYFRHKPFNCDVTDWNEARRKIRRSHSATLQNFQHTLPPTRDVGKHECARACACLAVRVTQREEQKKRMAMGDRKVDWWLVGGQMVGLVVLGRNLVFVSRHYSLPFVRSLCRSFSRW